MNVKEFEQIYAGVRAKDHISIDCEQCGTTKHPGKFKAKENIQKNGKYICQKCATANAIPTRVYTEEGRQRIAEATSYKRSKATKQKMRDSANKKWATPEGKRLKKYLAGLTTKRHRNNDFEPTRRRGVYQSKKMGKTFPFQSSYELKAILLLEADDSVKTYEVQIGFKIDGRDRSADFLINESKLVEVKPKRMLQSHKVQIQIMDNMTYADRNGYDFEIWSEAELGFENDREATKWADEEMSKLHGVDYVEHRKELNRKKAKKHYDEKIAKDTVEVECNFCNETHTVLRKTHEKNIARNGRYICEREGGSIAGKRSKRKKVNPYAAEGKKLCNGCKDVKLFEEFGVDSSKSDGYATRCKECRRKAAKVK